MVGGSGSAGGWRAAGGSSSRYPGRWRAAGRSPSRHPDRRTPSRWPCFRRPRFEGSSVTTAALPKPVVPGEGPEDDIHLTLREHLLELRKRLKWAVIFLGLGFVGAYHWSID